MCHFTAKKWLTDFIKKRFDNFGPYQDYIDKNNDTLFHSVLSSSINIGLLTPNQIINEVLKYKNTVRLESLEGFIRQLFWREYQRYCYIYFDFKKKNFFKNKKTLGIKWYNGTTKIDPIDDCIKKAFDTGYLHHIERLMVIGNFMNLSGITPKDGYKWFMEFSIDSYDWVMHQNVYDMVFFVSGGKTMRRPYISSSNYILKMSNYKKGKWSDKWNILYKKFIKRHKTKLYKFRYYFPTLNKKS
jgi:deoxyribodipyrimidine photolyase-related protein